jgi:hypothetical protein
MAMEGARTGKLMPSSVCAMAQNCHCTTSKAHVAVARSPLILSYRII